MPPTVARRRRAVSEPFSPLRFHAYARDLERALLDMSRETRMGGLSELKARLGNVPGIDTLNVSYGDGMQHITLNGNTTSVGVFASTDDIKKTLGLMTDTNPTPIPPNEIAPAIPAKSTPTMSITGAAHAGMSLKQMMADRKAKLTAAHEKLATNFGKLDQATAALDSLGDDVGNEAADLLASIGQFKNDLG